MTLRIKKTGHYCIPKLATIMRTMKIITILIAQPKPSAPCPVPPSPTLLWAARVCTIMLLLSLSLSLPTAYSRDIKSAIYSACFIISSNILCVTF